MLAVVLLLVIGGLLAAYFLAPPEHSMATRTVTVRTASAGTLAQVPDVVNHQQESALATLGTAGFESRVKAAPASEAAGVVVKESPAAGRKVRRGSAIALLVSLGKAKPRRLATRPRAERFEARQNRAQGILTAAGLGSRIEFVASGAAAGRVISQSPAGGVRAKRGTEVLLAASRRR
jgi:eukaryotic-like serine/threonine-protein kinase